LIDEFSSEWALFVQLTSKIQKDALGLAILKKIIEDLRGTSPFAHRSLRDYITYPVFPSPLFSFIRLLFSMRHFPAGSPTTTIN